MSRFDWDSPGILGYVPVVSLLRRLFQSLTFHTGTDTVWLEQFIHLKSTGLLILICAKVSVQICISSGSSIYLRQNLASLQNSARSIFIKIVPFHRRSEEVRHASLIVYGANHHNMVKYARNRTFSCFS